MGIFMPFDIFMNVIKEVILELYVLLSLNMNYLHACFNH